MLCYTWGTFKERIGKHYEKNGIMRCVHALVRLFGWMQLRHHRTARNKVIPLSRKKSVNLLAVPEALGNSEDSSALSAADKEKCLHLYEQYGMTPDAASKMNFTYNGNLVR